MLMWKGKAQEASVLEKQNEEVRATRNAVSMSIIGCPVSNGQPENTYAGNIIQIKKGVNCTFRNTYEHTQLQEKRP